MPNEGLTAEHLTYFTLVAGVVTIIITPFLRLNVRISAFEKALIEQGQQLKTIAEHYREQEARREREAEAFAEWRKEHATKVGHLETAVAIHGESIRRLHKGPA